MKRILSQIWSVTRYVDSVFNGKLELTWINGKKVLDGQNSNYSYGSLQRILTYSLQKVYTNSVSETLLLGLGGGCVIESLREDFDYKGQITAIEIDSAIIDIANKEFNILDGNRLKIVEIDAFNFVEQCQYRYDLIIIDLFIDVTVPAKFYSLRFWELLIPLINPNGCVIFNAGINLTSKDELDKIVTNFDTQLNFTRYEQVEETNTVLIARKLSALKK